ncbi:MAG: GNAT family N-acetyltransferase [Clostridiales bacterium]|nr:GNAT family N-acetyltransferase [Clostridiales bacterium]
MITLQEYCANPCETLSIPYWKAKGMSIPSDMDIVHHSRFREEMAAGRQHSRYFRLIHHLRSVPRPGPAPSGITFAPISADRAGELADMINRSYRHSGIQVTEEEVRGWTNAQVYRPELWIGAFAEETLVGSAIGEFDPEAGEAVIEWLQVLPEYRRRGIAAALVLRTLNAMAPFADFATVSGECDNPTQPETVYRACGFQGDDVWHILR